MVYETKIEQKKISYIKKHVFIKIYVFVREAARFFVAFGINRCIF